MIQVAAAIRENKRSFPTRGMVIYAGEAIGNRSGRIASGVATDLAKSRVPNVHLKEGRPLGDCAAKRWARWKPDFMLRNLTAGLEAGARDRPTDSPPGIHSRTTLEGRLWIFWSSGCSISLGYELGAAESAWEGPLRPPAGVLNPHRQN